MCDIASQGGNLPLEHQTFPFFSQSRGVYGHSNGALPWEKCEDFSILPSANLVGVFTMKHVFKFP